jgi:hypothetical protein
VLISYLHHDIPVTQSHHDRYTFRVQLLPTHLQPLFAQVTIKRLTRMATAMLTNSLNQCKHFYAPLQQGFTLSASIFG